LDQPCQGDEGVATKKLCSRKQSDKKMKKIYWILFCMICLLISSCVSIPLREVAYRQIREAEAVLQQAQNIEAPVYALETYLEAQLKIRKARKMVRTENYSAAKSLAQEAIEIGEQAQEETLEESMRIRGLAERRLFRGQEIWNRYEKGDEKKYALETLIEIKKLLEDGNQYLESNRHMEALKAAQNAHQKLAFLPDAVKKGKVSLLKEEEKKIISRQSAEEIIKVAQQKGSKIIEDARKRGQKIMVEAQVSAATARLEEFERIYPTTYKVKKGETILDIARRREIFNDTYMWPLIYKANRDQIRDPKLVYPGQILSIPRDITFEAIIEARKEAKAPPPYIPPYHAYNPEFYRRYLMIVPEVKDASSEKESKKTEPQDEKR